VKGASVPALRIALLTGLTLGLAVTSVQLESAYHQPPFHILYIQLAGAAFVVAGAVTWLARPELRLGELMVWVAIALYAEDLEWSSHSTISTVGLFLANASTPVVVHVLMAYPTGRVNGRFRRALVAATYVLGFGIQALKVPFTDPVAWFAHPTANAFLIHRSDALVDALTDSYTVVLEIIATLLIVVMVVSVIRATPLLRLVLLPAYVPFVLIVATAMVGYGTGVDGSFQDAATPLAYAPEVLYSLLPVGFLIGALSTRTSITAVTGLAAFEGPHEELETTLRSTLRDPDLQLLRPDAEPAERVDRAQRQIVHDGQVIAVLDHHADLLEEPQLLAGTASVLGVTLHNRALKELAESQRDEVRKSRLRILEAAHEARRRIERDLHDGTQQRLLAAIIRQRMLETDLRQQGVDTTELVATIDEMERALDELREIGRGIHSALVTERGLGAALRDMVARVPLPVRFTAAPLPPMDRITETALFFAASECVTNAVRHAEATELVVHTEADGPVVSVTIADNGRGGARVESPGVRGVLDRMEAIGGEAVVRSHLGEGTTVTLRVKVAEG
jgi:signal transduction histidine kinase